MSASKHNEIPKIVCGIDPGLGVKSPTGVAVFDAQSKEIYVLENIIAPPTKELGPKLWQIRTAIEVLISDIVEGPDLFAIEYFVMRGKGGESLQRLVGALLSMREFASWREVQNSKVKKALAGHGGATKTEVAYGVMEYFSSNKKSKKIVANCIKNEEWDILDSLAIAITATTPKQQ